MLNSIRQFERALLVGAACVLAALAQAQERIDLGILDVSVSVPAEWTAAVEREPPGEKAAYSVKLMATCISERCKRSQATCSIMVLDRLSTHKTFDAFLAAQRMSSLYAFLKTTRKSAGPDAEVESAGQVMTIGQHRWYVAEANSTGRFKSALRAMTVIDGRRLIADCRTCDNVAETDRYDDARAILASVKVGI